jgi:hypothetical protein
MKNIYQKQKINHLIIDSNYSIDGNKKVINLNKEGIVGSISVLNKIRNISNLENIKRIDEYFSFLKNDLNIEKSVPYNKILGRFKSKEYYNYLNSEVSKSISLISDYHTNIYSKRVSCYNNLHPVLLDNVELEIPKYNHCGITGRTSIDSGYNFLTIKKEKRKTLKSKYKDEFLVEIDFKSCEPFFYLKSQGFNVDGNDVYQWIMKEFDLKIEREKFKRGFLSLLYGAKNNTIKSISGMNVKDIEQIKERLKLSLLKETLEKDFNSCNLIFNYYGRPITSNNNLINYWIQSSAVDFCSLAFKNLIDQYHLKPCFFVHDSMTITISKNEFSKIKNINHITDPVSNINIPVTISKLSDN